MSRRDQERVGQVGDVTIDQNINVDEWGGVPVSPAVVKTDDLSATHTVPEIGAILQAFDGTFLQRMRATLDRVLSVAQFYFTAGEDPVPLTSQTEDSLRVHGAEVPLQLHLFTLDDYGLQPLTLAPYPVFTTQPPFSVPSGVTEVTFSCVYTAKANGGQARLRALFGNGFDESPELVINHALDITADPIARQNGYILEVNCPAATTAGDKIAFRLPVRIPRGEQTVRLVASEVGSETPGTMLITLTAGT